MPGDNNDISQKPLSTQEIRQILNSQGGSTNSKRNYFYESFHNRYRLDINRNNQVMVERKKQLIGNRNEMNFRDKGNYQSRNFKIISMR